MSSDGGVRAISGFLFQVLMGGALRAAGECPTYGREDKPELDALIELARVADVVHEFADQDVVLRRKIIDQIGAVGAELTLVQAKFSIAGTGRPISPGEMRGIVATLAKAKTRVENSGQRVGGYVLVTNRPLSPSEPTFNKAVERDIHAQLQTIPNAATEDWHNALAHFARRFGRAKQEIEEGRQKLLGRIFEATISSVAHGVITRGDLLTCLAGDSTARELTPGVQALAMQQDVSAFDADVSREPVQREILANIEAACAGRALVVFAGLGGSGKTAALHHWASEIAARASDTAAGPRSLVAIRAAHLLPEDWLAELVHDWNPAVRPVSRVDALDRLETANPEGVPILHLGLDGTDEYPDDMTTQGNVHRLARWFWQQDQEALNGGQVRARLVVTCREIESFARDCLCLGRSGGALVPTRTPLTFIFDRFSESELRELLRLNFPELELRMLRPTRDADGELNDLAGDKSYSSAARDQLGDLLRDPVIWRSFCMLNDEERVRLLAGEQDADLPLAQKYCERFLVKAESRTRIRADHLRQALQTVAERCREVTQRFRSFSEWHDAASAESGLGRSDTRSLFHEAASGGLIRVEQRIQWDWRNSLVERFFLIRPEPSLS